MKNKIKVIRKIYKMQKLSEQLRKNGKRIAFVPTMGALHEGHLSLLKMGRRMADILVMSIFVNPIQFNQREDFEKYPRDETRDMKLALGEGVDILFIPSTEEMYPEGFSTYVEVQNLTQNLCGAFRPGHFRGCTTVVMKLFNIVKPHIAIFGEKDFQQLVVLRQMVEDMNMDIKIVSAPTVREGDGLAMSSRNTRLSAEERRSALLIYKSLKKAEELNYGGEKRAEILKSEVQKILHSDKRIKPEYVKIVDPSTLQDIPLINDEGLLAVAAWVGRVRLIDNIKLNKH